MWPAGFKTGPTEMICVGRGTVNRPSKQMLKDLHWRHKRPGLDQQQPKGATHGRETAIASNRCT